MFSDDWVADRAQELDTSEQTGTPLTHFSKRFPAMGIDDGYRISRAWVALKTARGDRPIGHKIGLTSRAMQQASQIDEPDYGTLLESMRFAPGAIPLKRFISPRVEVELAFVLKRRLSGPCSLDEVLDATDQVQPAIEIIDARIEQFDRSTGAARKVFDTISDNAANAGIVLGGRAVKPTEVDLPWCGAVLRRNGIVEETGLAAGVQGHPAIGVAWLAERLAPWGDTLEAGEIILAGSFTRPVTAAKGDRFEADYGALGRFDFWFD